MSSLQALPSTSTIRGLFCDSKDNIVNESNSNITVNMKSTMVATLAAMTPMLATTLATPVYKSPLFNSSYNNISTLTRRDAARYGFTTWNQGCKYTYWSNAHKTLWTGDDASDIINTPGTNCVIVEPDTNVALTVCSEPDGGGNCNELVEGSKDPSCRVSIWGYDPRTLLGCQTPRTQSVIVGDGESVAWKTSTCRV